MKASDSFFTNFINIDMIRQETKDKKNPNNLENKNLPQNFNVIMAKNESPGLEFVKKNDKYNKEEKRGDNIKSLSNDYVVKKKKRNYKRWSKDEEKKLLEIVSQTNKKN